MRLSTALVLSLVPLVFAGSQSSWTNTPPTLEPLFTAELEVVPNPAPILPGPKGIRVDCAITGGTVTGKHGLNGSIRPDSSDWAILDPRTGLAFADARWALRLPPTKSTGGQDAFVYVQSSGPSAPPYAAGGLVLHLRLVLETGVPEYYWLNNVVVIGLLEMRDVGNVLDPTSTRVEVIRIRAYTIDSAWKPTDKVFTVCPFDGCLSLID
ncbi:hypothetical protein JCM16303_004717 [Sporobolomyces ruberrimus]